MVVTRGAPRGTTPSPSSRNHKLTLTLTLTPALALALALIRLPSMGVTVSGLGFRVLRVA